MGMDLYSAKLNRTLHMNWSGWRFFGEMLERRNCDTSEMSGLNDQDPISAKTCKNWALALKQVPLNQEESEFFRSCEKHNEINIIDFLENCEEILQC